MRHLTYSRWLQDFDLDVFVNNSGMIFVNNEKMTLTNFKRFLLKEFSEDIKNEIDYHKKEKNNQMINKILKKFDIR
jgi:hypothetical protein